MKIQASERLIVALDAPPADPKNPYRLLETAEAFRFVEELGDAVQFYKIGWPLYMAAQSEGVPILKAFRERGKRIFLDLKFGDIPETVKRLVAVVVKEQVDFLTINAPLNSLQAAAAARGDSGLKLLLVTLLTSQGQDDLEQMGVKMSVDNFVLSKAQKAREIGRADGVISSGREASLIREHMGKDFLIITPGIRAAGEGVHDHKRAVTPASAVQAGADYLVVGRPITQAANARAATLGIIQEMQWAFDGK